MSIDYESLTYKNKAKRAARAALIILLICAVVVAPLLWLWMQSVEQRQALRSAKNVVQNMNLLGIENYGFDVEVIDKNRTSGMTEEAEERVVSYSGAGGEIHLISWDIANNRVSAMDYYEGRFLVHYEYDRTHDGGIWEIYWKVHQYGVDQE